MIKNSVQVFRFLWWLLIRCWTSCIFPHCVVVKCSDVSEEHTTFIFRVTELVPVTNEVMQWKEMCRWYRTVWGNVFNHSYTMHMEGTGLVPNQWRSYPLFLPSVAVLHNWHTSLFHITSTLTSNNFITLKMGAVFSSGMPEHLSTTECRNRK